MRPLPRSRSRHIADQRIATVGRVHHVAVDAKGRPSPRLDDPLAYSQLRSHSIGFSPLTIANRSLSAFLRQVGQLLARTLLAVIGGPHILLQRLLVRAVIGKVFRKMPLDSVMNAPK